MSYPWEDHILFYLTLALSSMHILSIHFQTLSLIKNVHCYVSVHLYKVDCFCEAFPRQSTCSCTQIWWPLTKIWPNVIVALIDEAFTTNGSLFVAIEQAQDWCNSDVNNDLISLEKTCVRLSLLVRSSWSYHYSHPPLIEHPLIEHINDSYGLLWLRWCCCVRWIVVLRLLKSHF